MSFEMVGWAFGLDDDEDLSAPEKWLLVVLASCHNGETGQCNPGAPFLVRKSRLSRATVYRTLASLREKGLIDWEQGTRADGSQAANNYVFPWQPPRTREASRRASAAVSEPDGGSLRAGQVESQSRTGGSLAVSTQEETGSMNLEEEHSRPAGSGESTPPSKPAKPGPAEHPAFAEFWAAYPRRIARADALKAWTAAVKTAKGPGPVIAGARAYAARCRAAATAAQYIAYPATWLRAERWNDPEEPAPSPAPPRQDWAAQAAARADASWDAAPRTGPDPWQTPPPGDHAPLW